MKKFSISSLLIFVIGLGICISCSWFFSSAILSANFSTSTGKISFEKQTVYAICTNKTTDPTQLDDAQNTLQSQNGAGFVLEKDGQFLLLASLYQNQSDAEKVKSNLVASGTNCSVEKLSIPAKSISGNFTNQQKTILTQCLKLNLEIFKDLYDVAISLDTKVFDKPTAKLECNNIFSKVISVKTNFETFFENDLAKTSFKEINSSLKKTEECLSKLIGENFENSGQTFSSLIKLTYFKILFE